MKRVVASIRSVGHPPNINVLHFLKNFCPASQLTSKQTIPCGKSHPQPSPIYTVGTSKTRRRVPRILSCRINDSCSYIASTRTKRLLEQKKHSKSPHNDKVPKHRAYTITCYQITLKGTPHNPTRFFLSCRNGEDQRYIETNPMTHILTSDHPNSPLSFSSFTRNIKCRNELNETSKPL